MIKPHENEDLLPIWIAPATHLERIFWYAAVDKSFDSRELSPAAPLTHAYDAAASANAMNAAADKTCNDPGGVCVFTADPRPGGTQPLRIDPRDILAQKQFDDTMRELPARAKDLAQRRAAGKLTLAEMPSPSGMIH